MDHQRRMQRLTRRHLLAGTGLGALALTDLMSRDAHGKSVRGLEGLHFAAKAKSVIFLFMAGAPSQLDLFDPKPTLQLWNGKPCPEELIRGERFAFISGRPRLLGSPYKFARHQQSGRAVSELLPHFAKVVDDVAMIKSMHTTQFNHAPAQIFMNTGHQIVGRPSMGSWLTYGLGSENQDLPSFVVMLSGDAAPDGGKSCWGSGYLPTSYQGVEFRSKGDPVLFLSNPNGVTPEARRNTIDTIKTLNGYRKLDVRDPEIDTRISAYEMAYRMQTSVPDLMDISKEPASTHAMYGTNPGQTSFANNCLLARKLVESGVRFVQLFHRGWDHHGNSEKGDLVHGLPARCKEVDQAMSALVTDLKQRGLLETTLVVWGGEFGRTPMNEERGGSKLLGRDHNPKAFTMWVAGGGVKPGIEIGETDEFGYRAVRDPVHVHDLHATALHLLGVDHTKLVFKFQGRNFRLTDVHGKVVQALVA
ncbi:MAG: DUF1501 domain-containing protein [Deltaproteobacteria bacterium]|nr:DUF1501 domain-containing protein [Deltaproteobacteria bacterium]